MNPSWIKTQADREKVYRQYMANLALEQKNINKTGNALKKVELTGVYTPPVMDTRTTTEKFMDIYKLRNELQSSLYQLMSPDESAKVVSQLTEDEILFARTQIESIIKDLKPRFALGVPSIVFINYLRKLLEKFIATEGVENYAVGGVNVSSNAILSSFADIRNARIKLEKLQEVINQVQQQMSVPSTSTELVPFRQANNEIQNALFLLPTPQELEILRNLDIQARTFLHQTFTDIERFYPDEATVENMIRTLLRASQRGNIDEAVDIIRSINSQIRLSPDQQTALKQIKNMTEEESKQEEELSQMKSEDIRLRKESVKKNKSGMLSKLEERQREAGGAKVEEEKQESPVKLFKYNRLSEENQAIIDNVEFPISREKFIKLKASEKRAYIARAIQEGEIESGVNEKINVIDEQTGLNFISPLTPQGLFSTTRVNNREKYTPRILNEIYDKYLASTAPSEEPIEEISGRPQRNVDILSVSSPTGVASLKSQQVVKKGKGITGRGVTPRNRVEGKIEGTPQPKSEFSFAPLGRYIINTNKLHKCILTINTKTGKSIPKIKSKAISKQLTEIIKDIVKGKEITNDMTNGLTEEDIDTLYNVLNECQLLSKYNTPTSQNLTNIEKELNRFMLLKGQILAGQNNESVVREFKVLLLKYMKKGQIPRSQAQEILEELIMLGY